MKKTRKTAEGEMMMMPPVVRVMKTLVVNLPDG